MALHGYPPEDHVLRDLGLEIEVVGPSSARARMAADRFLLGADGGVRSGVLATLVDLVGGAIAARVLRPDWMATADLTLQVVRPLVGPVVEATGTVLRKGRTTLVVEVFVADRPADRRDGSPAGEGTDDPQPSAWATMTFAILPRNDASPSLGPDEELPDLAIVSDGILDRPIADKVAIEVVDAPAGRVSMPVGAYVHNSIGAAQGGVMALVGDVAAAEAVGSLLGTPAATVDLQVSYLALGRVGPIVTKADVTGTGPGSGSALVELVDEGAGGRLATIVNACAVAP